MSGSTYDWLLTTPAPVTPSPGGGTGGSGGGTWGGGAVSDEDVVGGTGSVIALDISCTDDIDESLSLVYNENELLAQSIARRLITPRGSLCYNTDYGFDARAYLNAALTARQVKALESAIASECEKDERVSVATVKVRATPASSTMTIHVELETSTDTLELTLLVSSVTVDILRGESQ